MVNFFEYCVAVKSRIFFSDLDSYRVETTLEKATKEKKYKNKHFRLKLFASTRFYSAVFTLA